MMLNKHHFVSNLGLYEQLLMHDYDLQERYYDSILNWVQSNTLNQVTLVFD